MTDDDRMREVFQRCYALAHKELEKIIGPTTTRTQRNGVAGLIGDFVMGYEDWIRPRNDGKKWVDMFREWLKKEHGRKTDQERLQ